MLIWYPSSFVAPLSIDDHAHLFFVSPNTDTDCRACEIYPKSELGAVIF